MSRRRRTLLGVAALSVVAGGILWSQPRWLIDRLARLSPGCLYRVQTDRPAVALTIDDGPDPLTTELILAELRRNSARATFFLIGGEVPGREPVVRQIVAEGHEIGNHGMYDRPAIGLDPDEFATDVRGAGRALAAYGPVRWARPGSGWYTGAMVTAMRRNGYRCALGSVYPFDAALPFPALATRHILRNVRPGAIVILHDGGGRGRRTAEVLREVLPELRQRGYRVVTLSELASAPPATGTCRG